MDEIPVTLSSLANGAAMELFDEELAKVVENVLDPNTDPQLVREISLKVKIKPDESRRMAGVVVQVTSKTGPYKGVGTQFWFGKKGGRCFAVENNPAQGELFENAPKPTAVNFKTGEVADGNQ